MTDSFSNYTKSIDGPLTSCRLLTPSTSVDLSFIPRALYVCATSEVTISFIDIDDNTISGYIVSPSTYHPIRIKRLLSATAGSVVFGWE
jgi:hypothetical protein